MSKNDVVPSSLEVDYDKNITRLYKAISQSNWDEAIQATKSNPEEARTWVVRHYEDSENEKGQKEIMWRFLPIHSACARQPPANLIAALLEAYPDGAKCVDDQGMYALHYACGNQAAREVIRLLLMSYPDAAKMKDPRGMLPIHYLACWGPSSISVIDMVLVANRDVSEARDEDGNTPLDLAKEGEYTEREAVIAALKRWLNNSGSKNSKFNNTNNNSNSLLSNLKPLSMDEKKQDDMEFLGRSASTSPRTMGLTRKNIDSSSSGWENRFKQLEDESMTFKYNIAQLRDQLKEKDAEVEQAYYERDALRQTLADLTEQHDKFKKRSEILSDRLGSMNASLLTMMEQQDVVLSAMKAREEQWQTLSELRREKLKELIALEEEETCEEVELRTCLMKQTKEMEAIKAVIAAVRQHETYY